LIGLGFDFDGLEHAPEPAFVLDPFEGRFVAANPAWCAVLGYTIDELLETPVWRIHPGELPQLHELVTAVLDLGHGTTNRLTCKTRSGTCQPTEISLFAFESDGRTYLLGLVEDRSAHRERRPD
jgi:PAS domain S-box-containing protein